jgi:hypothetical protein
VVQESDDEADDVAADEDEAPADEEDEAAGLSPSPLG